MADLAQQAAQSYPTTAAPSLAGTAALANAVAAAPNVPTGGDPSVPVGLPPAGVPIPQAPPAQDSTIVVTPSPAPPPKITVVPKPPGPPSAQPAGTGGVTPPSPEIQGLMANATTPPDPTGDAVDQVLAAEAADHGRASAKPPTPGDMAASGAAATAAGQAQSAALTEAGAADQQAAAAETKAREQQARETEQKAAEQKQIRDQATAHVQELREKAAKEPYHAFLQGEPGRMVLAGLGILLGSASYSANHVNQANGLVDRAIKQDFDRQQAQHAQLWKDVDAAMAEGQQLRADQLDEMANFRARQAQTLDAVIAKGKELSGRAKNKEMAAALDAKNTQLAFERDKAYDEVSRLKAAQLETERHNKAEEAIGRTHAGAAMLAAKSKANADQDEKVIKLAGKAYPATKDAIKAVKTADDADELVKTLKTNPSSLASSLGLERLVSVFSGGGRASITALKMVKPNAGSWLDITADDLSRAFTGTQGSALRSNLTKVAEEESRHATDVVEGHREKARGALKGLAKHAPDAVENYITGIFGGPRTSAESPRIALAREALADPAAPAAVKARAQAILAAQAP